MLKKFKQWVSVKKILISLLVLLAIGLISALIFSLISISCLRNYQLAAAGRSGQIAKISLTPVRWLTFQQVNTLEAWHQALVVITLAPHLQQELATSISALDSFQLVQPGQDNQTPANLVLSPTLMANLTKLSQAVDSLTDYVHRSRLFQSVFSAEKSKQLSQLTQILISTRLFVEHFGQGQHNVVVLLQNNDEIRANGGFMGSVASFSLKNGQITDPIFYDIYDLDSQITQLRPAPVGVQLYLSGGKDGMSLTDANWQPDFSQAAQDILALLDQTHLPRTDLIMAVNLDLIRDILQVTGPILLPDYPEDRQTVTADNLNRLAREDRYQFFAGDKQKKLFLRDLYTHLKIQLTRLNSTETLLLAQTLLNSANNKHFFFYSRQSTIQEELVFHSLAGIINPDTDFFLFPMESNVGINKANQAIERQAKLSFSENLIELIIEFQNNNRPLSPAEVDLIKNNPDLLQATHLGYVNYFRVITNLQLNRVYAECGGQAQTLQEESLVKTHQGQANQIGFLITVPEQSRLQCKIELMPRSSLNSHQTWTVLKQPGLPETEYNIVYFGQELRKALNQDIHF